MRFTVKWSLFVCCLSLSLLSAALYYRPGCEPALTQREPPRGEPSRNATDVPCVINGEYEVSCKKWSGDVFVPFHFISSYFEITGKLEASEGGERLQWSHSYSKAFYPREAYSVRSAFLSFENYNVESRDRVKCISAIHDVPVSTQWSSHGYLYPTQIAQYGLSHYSKLLVEGDSERFLLRGWQGVLPADGEAMRFSSATGASVRVEARLATLPSLCLWLVLNGSLEVELNDESGRKYLLRYETDSLLLQERRQDTVVMGLGPARAQWRCVCRDLHVDAQKALAVRRRWSVVHVTLRGEGKLLNASLSRSHHRQALLAASEWIVQAMTEQGALPIPVARRQLELSSGWSSAMAQGHAMSLLCRAFLLTGRRDWLEAAKKAALPLAVPVEQGGVRAKFLGLFDWYEEYPSPGGLFVLNGFLYALFGLRDLHETACPPDCDRTLYEAGLRSLRQLLPLFDTGSGSTYDLRHFTRQTAPNRARWDYHATHVTQLLFLSSAEKEPAVAAVAQRWDQYLRGKRAAHN